MSARNAGAVGALISMVVPPLNSGVSPKKKQAKNRVVPSMAQAG